LLEEGQIGLVQVEGIKDSLYALAEDIKAWEEEQRIFL
jgi:hypothetical protein